MGSTIITLLHEKINPKNWQVASPLVMQGFSNFIGLFQVIMANPVLWDDFINHEIRIPSFNNQDSTHDSSPRLLRCGVGTYVGRTSVTRKRCWILKMLLLWKTMEAPNRSIHGETKKLWGVNFFGNFSFMKNHGQGDQGDRWAEGRGRYNLPRKMTPEKSGVERVSSSHFCPVDSRAGFHIPTITGWWFQIFVILTPT